MWLHMVHHGGPGPDAPLSALAAERLPQELRRAKVTRPNRQAVPAVVLRRYPAASFDRLMLVTIALSCQS